jgi:hypothetical protein
MSASAISFVHIAVSHAMCAGQMSGAAGESLHSLPVLSMRGVRRQQLDKGCVQSLGVMA